MRSANFGPTPGSVSNSSAVAVLRLILLLVSVREVSVFVNQVNSKSFAFENENP